MKTENASVRHNNETNTTCAFLIPFSPFFIKL
jgi:hypothetical protein